MNQNQQGVPEGPLVNVLNEGFAKLDSVLASLQLSRNDHGRIQQALTELAKNLDPALKANVEESRQAAQRTEALQAELTRVKDELNVLRLSDSESKSAKPRSAN